MSGTSSPYSLLPAASLHWLSTGTNLARTEKVIEFAEDTSTLFPLTSGGGVAKIEHVNYSLASWLNTSGATATIASMANDSAVYELYSHDSCTQIPAVVTASSTGAASMATRSAIAGT